MKIPELTSAQFRFCLLIVIALMCVYYVLESRYEYAYNNLIRVDKWSGHVTIYDRDSKRWE